MQQGSRKPYPPWNRGAGSWKHPRDPWDKEDFCRLKHGDGGVMQKGTAGRGESTCEAISGKILACLRTREKNM